MIPPCLIYEKGEVYVIACGQRFEAKSMDHGRKLAKVLSLLPRKFFYKRKKAMQ